MKQTDSQFGLWKLLSDKSALTSAMKFSVNVELKFLEKSECCSFPHFQLDKKEI